MTYPEGYETFKTKKLVNGQERKYRYKKINGKLVYQKYDKKDWIEKPPNPHIGRVGPNPDVRTPVYGVGINDVFIPDYSLSATWSRWNGILRRTDNRDTKWVKKNLRYKGCTMDPRWFKLSVFKEWTETWDDPDNKEIDKDILIQGNKHYGPDTCLMVRPIVNSWFKPSSKNPESGLPWGVTICNMWKTGRVKDKPYRTQINPVIREGNTVRPGKRTGLGRFDTAEEASFVFQQARKEQLGIIIDTEDDPRVKDALIKHMEYDELHMNYW
jgi:hypothetical protein|tara:strand:+ start:84 stop:893 length:810 start_codon:yes stop_codon:yes gene_type:complete